MSKRFTGLVGITIIVAVVATFSASSASANGCTPGFWKNRAIKLNLYNSGAKVNTVFTTSDFGNWTLVQALQGGGGSTLVAKKRILLRAAVAAYLNYTVQGPGVFWTQFSGAFGADGEQLTVAEFQGLVNTALASSDGASILLLASHRR